tara:strand:+ start:1988 stop:2512 length:525 start_codon:yes stop_codon:yes gene_type:complete
MITLKENQLNIITYQKETDTPLVTGSIDPSFVYNVIIYPTMANDTGSASITYTTSSSEENPRWTTLGFDISSTSTSSYDGNTVAAYGGTTYNLEVWYGLPITGSTRTWGETTTTWASTTQLWSFASAIEADYNTVTEFSTLEYKDRIFVSGSTTPNQVMYISSNEDATYTIYQG